MKEPGLLEPVLAGGRLDHHERLVGRPRKLSRDHALELRELLHEIALGVEAPRRVDEEDVDTAGHGRLHGVEDHRGGIGAGPLADNLRAGAPAPLLELLDGRGPEGVGRGQEHALPGLREGGGELAGARGLARAIDAQHEHHARPRLQLERRRRPRERLFEELSQEGTKIGC